MTTIKTLNVPFEMSVVSEGAPLTAAIYNNCSSLTEYLEDQFFFPQTNKNEFPYYIFKEQEVKDICLASESVYGALVDSLELLFTKYSHKIPEFYGREFLEEHPDFVNYAKHTYDKNHEAIYGRFDIAFDFDKGKVLGFYEFNGDTPVMLFESVYMQDWFAKAAGKESDQSNYWAENLKRHAGKVLNYKCNPNLGIISSIQAIEDALTAEQLNWVMKPHADCYLYDIEDLLYNFANKEKPFHVGEIYFDFIWCLQPWEEMCENSPDIIKDWREWGDNVRFLEPAWRWFVANKGGLAWLWWLMTESGETEFIQEHALALQFLLPTYMTPMEMEDYVQKPLMGRLSNNIQIYKNKELFYSTDGFYDDAPVVYQQYCAPHGVEGRGKAIIGVWMAPWGDDALTMEASSVCIREFDMHVTDIGNERFIPHLVEE